MEFIDLFPTTIARKQLTIYNNIDHHFLVKYLEEIPKNENSEGIWTTKNEEILNTDENFSILKNTILDSCKEYLKELGYVFEDIYISSSWGVVTPTEKQTNVHIHGNSWISGTYYFTGGSPISFWKSPQKGTYVGQKEFNPDNPRTFGAYNITPIPGTLVLFPSTLEHKVEISNNELPRISLAFNIIPTGVFGPPTARIYPPKI